MCVVGTEGVECFAERVELQLGVDHPQEQEQPEQRQDNGLELKERDWTHHKARAEALDVLNPHGWHRQSTRPLG